MISRIFSVIILFALTPLLLVISVIIWLEDGYPVLFVSDRVGKNSKTFRFYKFRTMRKDTPLLSSHDMHKYPSFLLKSGSILRRSSLDELPNLINVAFGDMELIGYRPSLITQVNLNRRRNDLQITDDLPGITGLAQIKGRDLLSDRNKLRYELFYKEKKNFKLKLFIIFMTIQSNKNVTH